MTIIQFVSIVNYSVFQFVSIASYSVFQAAWWWMRWWIKIILLFMIYSSGEWTLKFKYKIVRILKRKRVNRIHAKMNNRKRSIILYRVLQKTHNDHPNLREYLDKSMVEICREKNVSLNQVFFFPFFVFPIIYGLLRYAMLSKNKKIKNDFLL